MVLKDKKCRRCKEVFRPRKVGAVFCGMACYLADTTKRKPQNCKSCGKEYLRHTGVLNVGSKYCSQACSAKGSFKQVGRKCRNCGDEFTFKLSQTNHYTGAGKYCSRDCSYAHQVKVNATKPVKDKYGRTKRKADVEWAKAVKEKHDYTCQRCGTRDETIHAHHKATRGAHPELKHDVSNGIPLCNSCHSWVHHHPAISYENGWLSRG